MGHLGFIIQKILQQDVMHNVYAEPKAQYTDVGEAAQVAGIAGDVGRWRPWIMRYAGLCAILTGDNGRVEMWGRWCDSECVGAPMEPTPYP